MYTVLLLPCEISTHLFVSDGRCDFEYMLRDFSEQLLETVVSKLVWAIVFSGHTLWLVDDLGQYYTSNYHS